MDQLVDRENVSINLLHQIFDNAFIENSLDGDDLKIQGRFKVYLSVHSDKRFIRYWAVFSVKDGVESPALTEYCENVHDKMIVMRLCPLSNHKAIVMDWYQCIEGGVTPKNIVMASRTFEGLLADAIRRDTTDVLA